MSFMGKNPEHTGLGYGNKLDNLPLLDTHTWIIKRLITNKPNIFL